MKYVERKKFSLGGLCFQAQSYFKKNHKESSEVYTFTHIEIHCTRFSNRKPHSFSWFKLIRSISGQVINCFMPPRAHLVHWSNNLLSGPLARISVRLQKKLMITYVGMQKVRLVGNDFVTAYDNVGNANIVICD